MQMAHPRGPLIKIVPIMAHGTIVGALCTSSAKCAGPSYPMSGRFALINPTNQASPLLPQPALSVNVAHTSFEDPCLLKYSKGTRIARNPER